MLTKEQMINYLADKSKRDEKMLADIKGVFKRICSDPSQGIDTTQVYVGR